VASGQTIGIVVGVLSGISGVVLGFINLYLRWKDWQPRLHLEADFGGQKTRSFYGGQTKGFLFLDVTNPSPMVESTVTRVFLALSNGNGRVEEFHLPQKVMWVGGLTLPRRIKVRDLATFRIDLQTLCRKLHEKGYRDSVFVTPKIKDALGNVYEAQGETLIPIDPSTGPGGVAIPTIRMT